MSVSHVSFITVYAAQISLDERGPTKTIGYFSDKRKAEEFVKGKSWYGGDGWVDNAKAIAITSDTSSVDIYLLKDPDPIDLDLKRAENDAILRAQALKKLSANEKRVLGIKE